MYLHDLVTKYVQEIQTYSIVVQAVSSIILVIVTTVYASFSYKLLHAPHRAFLVPVSIKVAGRGWMLVVRNLGPGLAKNLKVTAVGVTIGPIDPVEKGKGWNVKRFVKLEGPQYLMPNEEKEYRSEEYLLSFDHPFYITWKSLTGKSQKTPWLVKGSGMDSMITLGFLASVQYEMIWYKNVMLSPFNSLIKWYRLKMYSK
jgi:hypothetical protein